MSEPLKIEVGKFYRGRNGNKIRIYAADGRDEFPIHGAVFLDGQWWVESWKTNGRADQFGINYKDIVSEWSAPPEVDWSKMAAWHIWVAMDSDGKWFAYFKRPALNEKGRCWCDANPEYCLFEIPPPYAPKFTGDWKESLVCRPGHEVND